VVIPPPQAFVASTVTVKAPSVVGVPLSGIVVPESAPAVMPAGRPFTALTAVVLAISIDPVYGTPTCTNVGAIAAATVGVGQVGATAGSTSP
jgi:hypothetical protein